MYTRLSKFAYGLTALSTCEAPWSLSQSDSPIVHLMSLRKLSQDKCRSWVCVRATKHNGQTKHKSFFKQHISLSYEPNNVRFIKGIYITLSWNWDFSCTFFSSAKFTLHLQCPTQWNDFSLFHMENSYTLSRPKPGVNDYYVVYATH